MNSGYKKTLLFILAFGIFSGLFQSLYFLLVDFIGHGATKTMVVARLLTIYLLIKSYRHFVSPDLKMLTAFLLGIPIFIITLIILWLIFDDATIYQDHDVINLIAGVIIHSIMFSAILAFVFLPLHNLLRKRINKSKMQKF